MNDERWLRGLPNAEKQSRWPWSHWGASPYLNIINRDANGFVVIFEDGSKAQWDNTTRAWSVQY